MAELEPLLATLREGQRIGAIGPLAVEEAVEHSMRFVHALAGDATRVIDLGSGGGLPGLVIGWCRPDLRVTLVDRRSKRTDFLRRAVHRLDLDQRMVVITADVHDLGRLDRPCRCLRRRDGEELWRRRIARFVWPCRCCGRR